jgi:hypothetical protein
MKWAYPLAPDFELFFEFKARPVRNVQGKESTQPLEEEMAL